MEEMELSPEALRKQAALRASTERMRDERRQLETYAEKLEALARRKEAVIRRQQEFPAEIQAERQAIKDEYRRLHNEMNPLL